MLLQTTANGGISADYTIVVLVSVVGFLLVLVGSLVAWSFIRTLKQIEVELKSISDRVDQVVDDHRELETQVITMRAEMPDPDAFANAMILKIRTLSELKNL